MSATASPTPAPPAADRLVKTAAALEASAALIERYEATRQEDLAKQAACQTLAPEVVASLLKAGMIADHEQAGTLAALADPLQVLSMLKYAGEFHLEGRPKPAGGGIGVTPIPAEKAAGRPSPGFRVVGDRFAPSEAAAAADRALRDE